MMTPQEIQFTVRVVSNRRLCPRFWCLKLDAPQVRQVFRPGQFIHIRVSDGCEPLLRRPFSIYRAKKGLEVFYEVVGNGTERLSRKKPGDELDILGPLGKPFTLPGPGVKNVVMVAGGIGVAPFLALTDVLKKRKRKLNLILLYGGRTKDHTFDMTPFERNGCEVHVATDDGCVGIKGRVDRLFSKIPVSSPEEIIVYTCGPAPMMAAVQAFVRRHRFPAEGSCEEVMACALGACLGCVIPTREGYKTVCRDGPVFDLDEIVFA